MFARLTLTIALLWACCARADPGYYVVTVYDNEGVRTLDFRYWTVKFDGQPEVIWPEVGFGYGVSTRWTTELYASWIGSSQMPTQLSTWNWQNDVLLTQGEYPIDVAVHTNLIRNNLGPGGAIEWGPVLQTDVGRTQLNGNVFFENGWDGFAPAAAQMKYQWQVRHRWRPALHVGLQGFGELGAGTIGHRATSSRTAPGPRCSARCRWVSVRRCWCRPRIYSVRCTASTAACFQCARSWRSNGTWFRGGMSS